MKRYFQHAAFNCEGHLPIHEREQIVADERAPPSLEHIGLVIVAACDFGEIVMGRQHAECDAVFLCAKLYERRKQVDLRVDVCFALRWFRQFGP